MRNIRMHPVDVVDQYPLSPLQHGMLFQSLRALGSGVDIEQIVCTLRESVNATCLRQAWERVVERHDILRTAFQWEAAEDPVQLVHREVSVPWQEHDWRQFSGAERDEHFKEFLSSDRHRGFCMNEAPLLRLTLFQYGDYEFNLVWTFHHALIDGRCFPVLLNEVFAFYESSFAGGLAPALPQPKPYRDYIDWLQSQEFNSAETYWRKQLDGFTAPTPLVVDNVPGSHLEQVDLQGDDSLVLTEEMTAALKKFADDHSLTLNTLVQGAWALLLSRYNGEEDVVFGAVRACRKSAVAGAEDMVGLFINTLPMRIRAQSDAPVVEWLKGIREQWWSLRQWEHTPLVEIQKWSAVPAGKALFDSILMFENYDLDTLLRDQGGSWALRSFRLYEQTGYAITLTVYSGKQLRLQIEFDRSRFEQPVIGRMLNHLRTLLEAIPSHSAKRVCDLPMVVGQERDQLLKEWNNTQRQYPQQRLLHEFFEEQAEKTPAAVAVVFGNERLTYRELNERANQLAHYLLNMGVGPDTMVGVCMERSLELVVALYGVLKAGGAYVPIDPEYPSQRVAFMMQDASVPVLLTQARISGSLPKQEGHVLCLDSEWETIEKEDRRNLSTGAQPGSLAYMIYTSGSTGRPKGAKNSHRGICNRLQWMQEQYAITEADTVLQKTPFSFDVSVWEFFWPLMIGARLVVARPGGHRDASYIVRTINEEKVTVVHFVPSMLRMFLEEDGVETCTSLRHLICSGEALSFDLQEECFRLLPTRLHNLYGPTEAAVDVTHWTCRRDEERKVVPIGRPVANTQVYVLDKNMQPAPIGVPGELFLGGVQVGMGYHNRPELTAEKFIPDPFSETLDAKLYRTGDLCRWLSDGAVEYLGRLDSQVKIRGLRIELGEIEAMLCASPLVKVCTVIAREDASGDKQLIAYVVWNDEQSHSVDDLRQYLKERVPDYMVPSKFVGLKYLPLSPNGKIDRNALPAPTMDLIGSEQKAYVPPNEGAEQKIAEIWQAVLGVPRVGGTENFFDLGGDSLRMMKLRNQIQRVFGKDISIVDMFRCTTVRSLAAYLATGAEAETAALQNQQQVDMRNDAARRRLQLRRQSRVTW